MYELPAGDTEKTNLNANGVAYGGGFKLCIPCDNVTESGSLTLNAYSTVMQYNLYLAHNPTATEQSYIIADPSSIGIFAEGSFRWDKSEEDPVNAALQVRKVDGSSMGLEGAEFTLTGSGGTVRTGISDENGYIEWRDLPADETYVLAETKAPDGFTLVAPRNITLTAGQTAFVTIQDDTEKHFYIKKIDAQNGSTLEGAVFRFEQIDGDYVTTATTGFDGMLDFAGDELPYGSFRVWEERAPTGYEKDTSIETVDWDGTRDIFLTFENVRQPTIVVSKVDGITGISLPGATFNVYKDGELIDTVTTNDSGEFRFPIVAGEGYFEFEETVAPEGYQLDRTRHGIYVDPYDITVANTSNVPLDSFYLHDKIPYDIARATTLTTGTYSARLNYRILYKTNYTADYQVLASNLLTTNNYSFALNAIPMQAGEVVTDVYFDFGKVPVGFQSVAGPTLSVIVNGTAVGGYQMVNRADAGGSYQGTWQVAQTNWVTIIHKYTTTPTLPKTGY